MWYIHTIETKAGICLEDVDGGPETEALTCNGLSKYKSSWILTIIIVKIGATNPKIVPSSTDSQQLLEMFIQSETS